MKWLAYLALGTIGAMLLLVLAGAIIAFIAG